ncbi:MAG: HEPN domain-containing protein [Conexivisphaerales archaeon]
MRKSTNAIKAMEVNTEAGIMDWAVSAAYYAMYFAVYSLLSKVGIKCEIHDCTIALFEYLFGNIVKKGMVEEIKLAKKDRIESQYYVEERRVHVTGTIEKTKKFVLEVERIIDNLDQQQVANLRQKLLSIKESR